MNSKKIEDRLREVADDPLRFDDLLEDWNSAFTKGGRSPVTPEMERVADDTLIQIAAREQGELISGRLHQLLHGLPHAALVVDDAGVIDGMNATAMRRTVLGPGDSIDELDYALETAEPISRVLLRTLKGRNSDGEVALIRAIHTQADRSATLAIVPSLKSGASPQALVFLIDPEWRSEVEALVARAYQLTEAEIAVLMAFLDGHSTAEIAELRGTSVVTVRTQFQRLMEKSGAHTQAELMRNTLAISQFFQDIAPITATARHPHRKSFDIMRPGGRSLDVTLAGDMKGLPVLLLSTLSRHTFPDWYERELAKNGILAIHLWRQGQGGSDPLPAGSDLVRGMADDLLAPLDQLGIERCPMICFDASMVDGLRMVPDNAHSKLFNVPSAGVSKSGVASYPLGESDVAGGQDISTNAEAHYHCGQQGLAGNGQPSVRAPATGVFKGGRRDD
ncbi:MAG: sigma factor-like helix-turn-helix DNA-binding protein [Pseudomonadota bacterium]